MTRFTNFSDSELNEMGSAFCDKGSVALILEIQAEKKCRGLEEEKEKINGMLLRKQLDRSAMNANYGAVTKSCEDDEKLVVLCMINKTLKNMHETLEGMRETLARVDDKI